MHGSSSVPQEFIDLVNKYGGKMPNAKGVPEDQINMAVTKYGVVQGEYRYRSKTRAHRQDSRKSLQPSPRSLIREIISARAAKRSPAWWRRRKLHVPETAPARAKR